MDKKEFDDFIRRLDYHNRGTGVDWHVTSNLIFNVQHRVRDYGYGAGYSDSFIWVNGKDSEASINNEEELIASILEDHEDELKTFLTDQEIEDFTEADEFDREGFIDDLEYQKVYYRERWEYVNAHLTKEGAEAFMKRKAHDYNDMRIYVESQYWCWEFNEIINKLLDGDIGWIRD